MDLDRSELEAILEHARTALSEEEYGKPHAAIETLVFLTQELEKNRLPDQSRGQATRERQRGFVLLASLPAAELPSES